MFINISFTFYHYEANVYFLVARGRIALSPTRLPSVVVECCYTIGISGSQFDARKSILMLSAVMGDTHLIAITDRHNGDFWIVSALSIANHADQWKHSVGITPSLSIPIHLAAAAAAHCYVTTM